ncbi:MAG: M20/M25/M40 family metallo-hydrolase [Candidatus Thorarchaeota archaeon]
MKKKDIELIQDLVLIPSPSGFEEEIAEYIKQRLLKILPKSAVTVDRYHNVTAVLKGSAHGVVMVDAHADQVGFMVTNVDRKGFISLQYIGGGDRSILSARNLLLLTDKGRVHAVVGRRHAHLVDDEQDADVTTMIEAAVDIGPRSRKSVQSIVKVGDGAVYAPSFHQLRESYYAGCGMDDKVGCWVLLDTIKAIVKSRKARPTIVFTFSVQEETYGKKLRPILRKYNPDLFIEVDVTFATDWEDDDDLEREVGKCELGKGPVIYRGVQIDKKCFKLAAVVAKATKNRIQVQADPGSIGYTSTEVTHEGDGIRAMIFAVPLRNMHTPVEVIHTRDLIRTSELLSSFLLHRKLVKILEE